MERFPDVSVLFNEPKLLKSVGFGSVNHRRRRFSALQRAEIAEIITTAAPCNAPGSGFSALQRAEIAEMPPPRHAAVRRFRVSVLFNEPKLLKFTLPALDWLLSERFSALQRAEIAEMYPQ